VVVVVSLAWLVGAGASLLELVAVIGAGASADVLSAAAIELVGTGLVVTSAFSSLGSSNSSWSSTISDTTALPCTSVVLTEVSGAPLCSSSLSSVAATETVGSGSGFGSSSGCVEGTTVVSSFVSLLMFSATTVPCSGAAAVLVLLAKEDGLTAFGGLAGFCFTGSGCATSGVGVGTDVGSGATAGSGVGFGVGSGAGAVSAAAGDGGTCTTASSTTGSAVATAGWQDSASGAGESVQRTPTAGSVSTCCAVASSGSVVASLTTVSSFSGSMWGRSQVVSAVYRL